MKQRALSCPRVFILHIEMKSEGRFGKRRTPEEAFSEAEGLARALSLDFVGGWIVFLDQKRPSTLLGSGKIEELKDRLAEHPCDLLVINASVSPIQQRNLERTLGVKILDRTGLILEIFGARAQTKEGALQVELAHLEYQKSRLVRSWTHLERQRGGFGFLGGPGETQIETDRRLIFERISRIKADLEHVKRTRALHRKSRQAVPYPVVALVGYTNAGKSTVFNRWTRADVLAEDALFATLDPTVREMVLPGGTKILLADTVGFISDLPTHLIAAFRATLEEVILADVVIHVRDCSHSQSQAQAKDVEDVLRILGLSDLRQENRFELWNKSDLLEQESRLMLEQKAQREGRVFLLSALTGEGESLFFQELEAFLVRERLLYSVFVPYEDGRKMAWLHAHGEVLTQEETEEGVIVSVRLPQKEAMILSTWKNEER